MARTQITHGGGFSFRTELLLRHCDTMERLADSLPRGIDAGAALTLTDRMGTDIARCHRFEEAVVFPALAAADSGLGDVLRRLAAEHREDEDYAAEVRAAVAALLLGRAGVEARAGPEQVGYMLRGLFTSMRRHLAFERDYLLPAWRVAQAGPGRSGA